MEKKIIFSTLGGAITFFLGGWLIMGVILADVFADYLKAAGDCVKMEPDMLPVILANIVQALFLSILLKRFNVSTFAGGAIAGAWITFLMILWFDCWMFASFDFMSIKVSIMDILANTTLGALAGGVIGLILGKVR